MALPLLGRLPSSLQTRYRQTLNALDGLTVGEQLEVTCQVVVGILAVARLRTEVSHRDSGDFDRLCDAVEEWLGDRVAALRLIPTE
jgi:hypothetical protein